jgi:hypothetical protein
MFGFIYLILEVDVNGNERHKIGFTKGNPEIRLKSLQTGNSNKLSLLKTFKSKNYKLLEKWLHSVFIKQKTETENEWFTLTNEQVLIFDSICEQYDNILESYNKNKSDI